MKAQDVWWHLAAGRLMLERRALVFEEPWSFARVGAPWLNHEWLADVVFALWAALFGVESLTFWLLAVVGLAYVLLFDLLRRLTGSQAASLVAVLVAVWLARPLIEIRPHLYTTLGLVLTLRFAWLRPRPFVALPLLFAVWANLHSGCIFGLAVLALALCARGLTPKELALLWLACAAATLVNPHGIGIWTFALRYASGGSAFGGLREWLSPFASGSVEVPGYRLALAVFGGVVLAGFWSGRWRRRELLGWPALALGVATAAMSAASSRFVPYFGLGLAVALAPVLADLAARRPGGARVSRAWVLPSAILVAGLLLASRLPLRHGFDVLTTLETMPVETCEFANANRLSGRVLTYFGWGGYLIWCGEGRLRPFIDARADTVYDAETLRSYLQVQNLEPGWEDVAERVGADFVLWPTLPSPELPVVSHVAGMLGGGRWRLVHEDLGSALLARSDVPLPTLVPSPPSPYRTVAAGAFAMRRGDLAAAESEFATAFAESPGLIAACRNLSLVQALRGEDAAAWRTHARCERLVSEPGAAEMIRRQLARRR